MGNTGDKSKGYGEALLKIALQDDNVVIMTAENMAVIRGLNDKLQDRFIDVGIAEQSLVGIAAGLALAGRKVVVHALAPFLTMRAFEFIRTDAGLHNCDITLVGFIPGFLSDANGPTHQAIEDIALMKNVKNCQIYTPSCEEESTEILKNCMSTTGPKYIRLNHLPSSSKNIIANQDDLLRGFQKISRTSNAKTAIVSHGCLIDKILPIHDTQPDIDIFKALDVTRHRSNDLAMELQRYEKIYCLEDHLDFGCLGSELQRDPLLSFKLHLYNLKDDYFKPAAQKHVYKLNNFDTKNILNIVKL